MKRYLFMIALAAGCMSVSAQTKTKTTAEYMTTAGFTQVNDSTWAIGDRATVTMSGNYVKAFEAKQNHNWTMTFGNGSKQGAVVNVKSGDNIVFADGRLTFGNGSAFCPSSMEGKAVFKRSIVCSAIFNAARNALFATDIKTAKPYDASLGEYFPANSTSGYTLDAYGNLKDKVEAANDALQAKRSQNYAKAENALERNNEAEQAALYRKYGAKVIDGVQNGNIMVGAPIDMIMKMMGTKNNGYDFSYASKVVKSNSYSETREFYPEVYSPNEWHTHYHVTYSKKTNCVTSYSTYKKWY